MTIATVDDAVRAYPVNLLKPWQTAKKGERHANTSKLEKMIDKLVYKLYQLTYDEVKIIDPEFALTE